MSSVSTPDRDDDRGKAPLTAITPHAPLISTTDLPAPGGRIGPSPEDFCVDEVPLYEPSGAGAHFYVRLRKRGLATPEAITLLAQAASVESHEIGSAGMKDKHAVTTQWLSVPADRAKPPEAWSLPDGLQILAVSRHNNKLRTGHLRGNSFCIRLVDVAPDAVPISL